MSKERKQYIKEYHLKNKDKIDETKRKYYESNKQLCIDRSVAYNKSSKRQEWKEKNKDKIRNYNQERWLKVRDSKPHLKYDYGMTLEDYNKMYDSQNGCCFTCGTHQSLLAQSLNVDHDHKTGKVRGLLCIKCNSALGLVDDNIETLYNLINYLQHA